MTRVRFAPSPTGNLHVGNGRTAVLNYLFAKNQGGQLVLRIEDTDVERSEAQYEASILDDLTWLGITWDEGPVRQSDRLDVYREFAQMLLDQGLAYKCFCSKETLERARQENLSKGRPPRYNEACRALSPETVRELERNGTPSVLRFKAIPKEIVFTDGIYGELRFPPDHVDDFILMKQGYTPSYNFAVTIDDMTMGISDVIRGADHISNTPKQIMLFEAFGKTPPSYAHHSLLVDIDRKPLSKRFGATSIGEFRKEGILNHALFNYLAILGRSVERELQDQRGLIRGFSLDSLSPSDSLFDREKLAWFNKEYIRTLPVDDILRILDIPQEYGHRVETIRENAFTLNDMKILLRIFDGPDIDKECMEYLMGDPKTLPVAQALRGYIADTPSISLASVAKTVEHAAQIKGKGLFMLLRMLTTGRRAGPPLDVLLPLISKEIMLKRIETYLKNIQ